ncbi:hypothetical protein G3131_002120, partial [Neisseria gonorrhoeae]
KKDWREKGLDGVLEDVGEMAGAVLEQAPNALVPIATTTAGGILGAWRAVTRLSAPMRARPWAIR